MEELIAAILTHAEVTSKQDYQAILAKYHEYLHWLRNDSHTSPSINAYVKKE